MKKTVVFTALLSAILISACSDPCTKLSELRTEKKSCETRGCRDQIDIKIEPLAKECRSYLKDLANSDKQKTLQICEDDNIYYYFDNTCEKVSEDVINELFESDRQKAILKCENKSFSKTKTCREFLDKSFDELLAAKASDEGSDWKAQVCQSNGYVLSTFTLKRMINLLATSCWTMLIKILHHPNLFFISNLLVIIV